MITNTTTQATSGYAGCHFDQDISWSQADIQELKYGMLTLAISEVRDNRKSKKMKFEAWEWLMSDENSDHLFSAESCCSELGMNVENLRLMLNQFLDAGVIKL